MKKIINLSAFFVSMFLFVVLAANPVLAAIPAKTAKYFNGPKITNITNNSFEIGLSNEVLAGLNEEEKARVYFEYFETQKMCIMIYPTPEECLPKKTEKGIANAVIKNLKENTEYSVNYKIDGNIVCITAPCPTGEFISLMTTLKTKSVSDENPIKRSLYFGKCGEDVKILQTRLIVLGYLKTNVTGYFGYSTLKAVREFQKTNMQILPIGIVGLKTRLALFKNSLNGEYFSGKLEKVNTGCFADGICSVTISGKEVATIIGWRQEVVGLVKGVEGFGDLEKYIGKEVKVYAKKTSDGYTLYGSTDFYIELVK